MIERYSEIASREQVNSAIHRIANEILKKHNTSPLFVALLRGAAPFASKLMLEITSKDPDYHPELDYMMVSTYGSEQQAHEPKIITDIAPGTIVRDRPVIVLDDVLDKGITANFVINHIQGLGAKAIELAVLCDKQTTRDYNVSADYVGFEVPDNWLIGMGMDYADLRHEAFRWDDRIMQVKTDA